MVMEGDPIKVLLKEKGSEYFEILTFFFELKKSNKNLSVFNFVSFLKTFLINFGAKLFFLAFSNLPIFTLRKITRNPLVKSAFCHPISNDLKLIKKLYLLFC
ncbi:hypothetical protein BpHYR1_043436 [Brachionus plicatilis]|uniref:Uncharacterized protein n=1 Tax=Brachionus plicatilis TaxID=10195 RepID=A0A3M7S5X9_BRAPC|nr:hypothetical protein BpHYR1_043436 [Brachionus plicatilis]